MFCRNGRCSFSDSKPKTKASHNKIMDFMGFSKGQLGAPVEGEVIVGILDTGKTEERKN